MTKIICGDTDCLSNENGICAESAIHFERFEDCENYRSYKEAEEYRTEFWIACGKRRTLSGELEKDVEPYRLKCVGKKLELFGLTLYTQNDDRRPFECGLTEERTGYSVGRLSDMTQEKAYTIRSTMMGKPDVMLLPEGKQE
jgi:hypothetical protein